MLHAMFIRITPDLSVAPQIGPGDCAIAAAHGFTSIVNNRPDGEAADQPSSAAIAAAAADAGVRYAHIPVGAAGIGTAQIEAMAAELAAADGPVLAFCRSGTRSAHLWALAHASMEGDPEAIVVAAGDGGYDIGFMLPTLRQLAERA